jgi:CRISPR-associated protein Cas1
MTATLNTLFVATDGAWVHLDHDCIVVKIEREVRLRVPILHLASVICFGRVSLSPELLGELAERSIHVAWLSSTGRMLARMEGIPGGNVLLRRAQFRAADDPIRSLALARAIVLGKVTNQRLVLQHAARDAAAEAKALLDGAIQRLRNHLHAADRATDLDVLRGVEGIAARDYFGAFPALIKQQNDAFLFDGRSRRPPRDRVNALLSFGYVLLLQDCIGACAAIGLDPGVGFLHEERPGRLSLALDLMEELRAPVVDRLAVSLINLRQLGPDDVRPDEADGFRLTDTGRKTFLVEYQNHKRVELHHGFLDEQLPWGRVPHVQALLLARVLRGDLDDYPPFVIR